MVLSSECRIWTETKRKGLIKSASNNVAKNPLGRIIPPLSILIVCPSIPTVEVNFLSYKTGPQESELLTEAKNSYKSVV